ncbi:Uncharacterised protein [Vibrio cholerae]|nr:Uncharacterised protein [Vibrio cholerae]CSD47413.1 Uncharacterised protein [Vibrio cholerae]
MRLQSFLIMERGTVDTLQHFVIAVTTPVCTCNVQQFKVLTKAHVGYVWTTAHVNVFFVMVKTRAIITRHVFIKNFHFVAFATRFKGIARFLPAHFLFDNRVFGFR